LKAVEAKIAGLQKAKAVNEGKREALLTQLESEFGVCSVAAAEVLLSEKRDELQLVEAELDSNERVLTDLQEILQPPTDLEELTEYLEKFRSVS
jgi:hypothetical protein